MEGGEPHYALLDGGVMSRALQTVNKAFMRDLACSSSEIPFSKTGEGYLEAIGLARICM